MSDLGRSGPDVLVVPLTPDDKEWLSFRPGGDGWAIYRSRLFDATRAWLFLRFGLDRGIEGEPIYVDEGATAERTTTADLAQAFIEVREVLVTFASGASSARVLRDIPLTRIEAAVNQPSVRTKLLHRLPGPGAEMRPFVWDQGAKSSWWLAPARPWANPKIEVEVPAGRGRPDAFYEAVAAAFAYLATVSQRPAADMADANHVPVSTIHGWVKEARRRGFLPAGERKRRS